MPPPVNHIVLASSAVVAVSAIAIAAALAIYESPEVRRYAEDVRRRIAVAFNPPGPGQSQYREPRFNRPEDADGFLECAASPDAGVDADEESKRRQREELMYWNSIKLQKQREQAERESESGERKATSFDDFMTQDETADQGTWVFNTGADVRDGSTALRHRGGMGSTLYSNPFADEHGISNEEINHFEDIRTHQKDATADETMSNIYSATTLDHPAPAQPLIDFEVKSDSKQSQGATSATLDRDAPAYHDFRAHCSTLVSPPEGHREEAYASIQAWANDSSRDFYSPLPETPAMAMSEAELVSEGEMTPTDSISLAGSGEDIAHDVLSSRDGDEGRRYDVLSESEGVLTPASWSEIGSVVSENEGPMHA